MATHYVQCPRQNMLPAKTCSHPMRLTDDAACGQTWHTTKLALISCALYVPVRSSACHALCMVTSKCVQLFAGSGEGMRSQ